MKKSFSISEALNIGFNKLGKRVGHLLLLIFFNVVICFALEFTLAMTFKPMGFGLVNIIIEIAKNLFYVYLGLAFLMRLIELYDNDDADLSIGAFFNGVDKKLYGNYIITSLLYALVMVIPCLITGAFFGYIFYQFNYATTNTEDISALIIVIGCLGFISLLGVFYFAIKYSLAAYFIADRQTTSPSEALKMSAEATKGNMWNLIAFGIVICGVAILGCIALFIGLLFAYPVIYIAYIHVFRSLSPTSIDDTNDNHDVEATPVLE